MKLRHKFFLFLFILPFISQAQYNLKVEWEGYEEGDIVSATPDDGFDVVFRITNIGIPIPEGETIYLGITYEGLLHSSSLTEGIMSAAPVVDGDFGTGTSFLIIKDESVVLNPIDGGGYEEICIVVYGVGYLALDQTFSTDIDPSDNSFCVKGTVLDIANVAENEISTSMFMAQNTLNITSIGAASNNLASLQIYGMDGTLVLSQEITLIEGNTNVDLAYLPVGIYIARLEKNGVIVSEKIVVQ